MKHLTTLLLALSPLLALLQESARPAEFEPSEHPLAWITGDWVGEGFGGEIEETWLPPRGGALPGIFRLTRDDQTVFYEIFTIEDGVDGLVMRLKHFHPDLRGWEEKDEMLTWPGEVLGEHHARFGPVEYELRDDGSLRILVTTSTGENAQPNELVCRRRP